MLRCVCWVYITYGIGFKAKQNLDIKKTTSENWSQGSGFAVWDVTWKQDAELQQNRVRKLLWPEVKYKVRTDGW